MIDNKTLYEILDKDNLTDVEMIEVLIRYIFDRKNVEIKINRPIDLYNVQLVNIMYNCALSWYRNKPVEDENTENK